MTRFLFSLAWRDLKASGRHLWIFVACLVLGVSLVAAGGGLFSQVSNALRDDARMLFGGDAEIEAAQPLAPEVLAWIQAPGQGNAVVSRVVELRTMMLNAQGSARLVELQSTDDAYPLYGKVELNPADSLPSALARRNGVWGVAIDAALAQRMQLQVGETVTIGEIDLMVRALVTRQPDRSLRANWRGAPVLIAEQALQASGLVQPGSRVGYRYRVRTDQTPSVWRAAFIESFPELSVEVDTFNERSERIAEVLGQIGSGLMLIGFSALFIGGLGVFNSVQSFLQHKLASLATLRALGLRDGRLAGMVLIQIVLLALMASVAGVFLGVAMAVAGASITAEQLPVRVLLESLWQPAGVALAFGVLTAVTFALPALGRALSVTPAALFRGTLGLPAGVPRQAWLATATLAVIALALLVAVLPDSRFGLAFIGASIALVALLDLLTKGLRQLAQVLQSKFESRISLSMQLALASLQQPGSPLRPALISLGSALTLLVASTLVVATLLRTVNDTVPANAPALVFYDVQTEQIPVLKEALEESPGLTDIRIAPFVLGRLVAVNDESLIESDDDQKVLEARDEHKLSDRSGNFDDVVIDRGQWWPIDRGGEPMVAMEDREADQLGLRVGDSLRFDIMGSFVEAKLSAIYSQRRMQSRLWLEAIFSDGVLDPFITRHVGAAFLPAGETLAAQDRLAAVAPNIATVRAESILRETRSLMASASGGLSVVALVCLLASLLVLGSVIAASRTRQVYDATIMHALGARHAVLRAVLVWEYLILAIVTALFAIIAGSALATGLLRWRLEIDPAGLFWSGATTAVAVSSISLGLGAYYLLKQMRLNPASLLRGGG